MPQYSGIERSQHGGSFGVCVSVCMMTCLTAWAMESFKFTWSVCYLYGLYAAFSTACVHLAPL